MISRRELLLRRKGRELGRRASFVLHSLSALLDASLAKTLTIFVFVFPSQVIPLARHSPLPELRDLLYSLRPLTVYPNTLISKNSYPIEYLSLPFIFPSLPPSTLSRVASDISSWCCTNFPNGGEVAAWRGVKDWMVKGAAKSTPLGDAKEEYFVGGIEALKGVERGVVDAVGRAKMIGEGAKGLREVGWEELGEVEGWVGAMGGRGKLERVVGMVLRVCNAGNGDDELERKVLVEEEEGVVSLFSVQFGRVVDLSSPLSSLFPFCSQGSINPSTPPRMFSEKMETRTRNLSQPNFSAFSNRRLSPTSNKLLLPPSLPPTPASAPRRRRDLLG